MVTATALISQLSGQTPIEGPKTTSRAAIQLISLEQTKLIFFEVA
jgi:hypothetical protein